MRSSFGSTVAVAGLAGLAVSAGPASAQETPRPGPFAYSFASEVRANDNIGLSATSPGVSVIWDNTLALRFLRETPLSQLSFEFGGTVRTAILPNVAATTTFQEPYAIFGYSLEGANSSVSADASYRVLDLTYANPLRLIESADPNNTDLITDIGTRRTLDGGVAFEFLTNNPIGFGGDLGYRRVTYVGTTDPDLFDSQTLSAELFTRFRFSPLMEARLIGSWEDERDQDVDQTHTTTYGVATELDYDVNPITTITAGIGYEFITETTNLPSTVSAQGLSASLGITREMARGSAGVTYATDISVFGRRHTLTGDWAFEMPRSALDASVGVTLTPNGRYFPVGRVSYTYELPRGAITATLAQRAGLDTNGADFLATGATLGYETQVTRLSSISLSAGLASVEEYAGAVSRTTLTSLQASYSYELTPDWDLTAGVEHQIRTQSGTARRSSNEIFVLLEHTFD